jgi:hypothetical protein
MPAIGPEIPRRSLLLFGVAAGALRAAGDPAGDVWDMVTRLAGALGRGDASDFLGLCDSKMPDYETLRTDVEALTASYDANSGIDPVRNEGDDRARSVEMDWSLRLVDRTGLGRVTERRANVKARLEKRGRMWKFVGLDPISFFAPPSA